ncbi:MAG: SDR family NAD(P)-dependent oxidoreductase [Gammaproteobacteria bacterium]|nr:SDR family NAD(P)-dependent oxidoreductase [Gammaproteobacteria bacterium]
MTEPLLPPKRKDPLKRTPAGLVPPAMRSRAAKRLAVHAGLGNFVLQVCTACSKATYPPRDRCPECWSELVCKPLPSGAVIEAQTTIRTSTDLYFKAHLPWRIGTAKLDAGPVAIVHLHGDVAQGDRVRLQLMLDRGGNPALFALPEQDTEHMTDDKQMRAFTADPRHRRVLVTDGRSEVGRAVAQALVDAGARLVFLGNADPLLRSPAQIEAPEAAQWVQLDCTDTRSVDKLATQLGGRVDIVVNTVGMVREGGAAFGGKLTDLQSAMDVNVSGLMRLIQAFSPAMSSRSDDGTNSAAAFVDVASVYGLTGRSGYAGMAATAAARLSLLASLRGEMQQSGIRVVSVLTGPLDDEWHQSVPPPKVAPVQIARVVTDALKNGLETVCAGEVAKDVLNRWQQDPLLTIREQNL